ncbi:MAG TPA: biotin--[acetyl-CoA-carboxylase] ligase [Pyrinomonadaceae bacterium]|nr:biotin--[acetyl-CoA-carboxylase] ligase [Pyrinomonadaceae bacterium]
MNFTILRFDILESTNTEAINQARLGAGEGLCIVADQQTAGRGRHSRKWVSSKGSGLYFSIVLRPRLEARFLPLITLLAGVAVVNALSEFAIDSDIKWVNDVLVNEKKICGILAETVETANGLAVIVGIGINLKSTSFPDEIADTATSIETEIGPVDRDEVLTALTRYLNYFYEMLSSENGPAEIIREWQRRSSYFIDKNVRVRVGTEMIIGVTDGLEINGALRVRTDDGDVRIVQSGDVERLRAAKR